MADEKTADRARTGEVVTGEHDSYRIEKMLGEGGMGTVYMASADSSGRTMAIKFLHAELQEEGGSAKERFEREIKVLEDLRAFPGIVRIEDYGEASDETLFLVMEYVTAAPLNKLIETHTNGMPQIEAVQCVIQILSVLAPVHRQGFIHRDMKPNNVCYDDQHQSIRILDFGLSKPFSESQRYAKVTVRRDGRPTEITGSPHYMAPEQVLRPKDVDTRSDLYAVGITLYELLAGYPPFRGLYHQDILKQQQEKLPPPIDSCADGGPVSYRLQTVLNKSLAKNQSERYQTAEEFKEALYDVLNMLNKIKQRRRPLDDRYKIIRKIGQGGNAEVFEATDNEKNVNVALKVVREGSTEWDTETLMNEADRSLEHECVVRVVDFGSYEGRDALVMEMMDGCTLEDIIDKYSETGFPESLFYVAIRDVCRGLHHAHRRNIVHRDVKPSNMLINTDGTPKGTRTKLCDFGIAKRFQRTEAGVEGSKTTQFKGTYIYSSPEQCDIEGRLDPRSDIYSLGVVMYEMLSGEPPFVDGVLMMQHLQADPPPLELRGSFRNGIKLCEIVEKCLQKNPESRYQSMKELAQDLDRVFRLEPQKGTNKPYEMKTLPPEAYLDASAATQMNQQAGTSLTGRASPIGLASDARKKALLIGGPILALLVILGVFFIPWGSDGEPTPPIPEGQSQNEAAQDFAAVQSKIIAGAWNDVAAFDFKNIPGGSDERKKLAGLALGGLRAELVQTTADDAALRERRQTIAGQVDALAHIDPDHKDLDGVRSLLGAFDAFLDRTPPKPGEFTPWWDSELDGIEAGAAAYAALAESNGIKRTWETFVTGMRRQDFQRNRGLFDARVAKVAGDSGADIDADALQMLQELKKRAPLIGESVESSANVLQQWLTAAANKRFAATTDSRNVLKSGLEWIRKTGKSVFGLDDAGVDAVWADAAGGRRSSGFHGAMTRGVEELLRHENLPLLFQAQMGTDPFQWGARFGELEAVAPAAAIGRLVGDGALHHFESAETTAILERRLDAQKLAPKELEAERDRIDKAIRKEFIDRLPRRTANSVALRWETEIAAINSSGAVELGKILAALKRLNGASKLSEINAAFYRAREKRSEAEVASEALRLKNELLQSKRWISLLLLASSYRQLFDVDGTLSRDGRNDLIKLLDLEVEHALDYGIDGGSRANKIWSERTENCIRVLYKLPEGVALADDVEFRVVDGQCKVLPSGQLEVLVEPKRAFRPYDTDRVEIAMHLQIRHEDLNDIDLDLARRTIDKFDFESPGVRPMQGAKTGDVRIEIRDANPPKDGLKPRLLVNGKNLTPASTSGEANARVFDFSIALAAMKKHGEGEDDMEVTVSDDFGNVATVKLDKDLRRARDAWRFDRDSALKSLATDVDADVRRAGFGKAGLDTATARIEGFEGAVTEFSLYFGGDQKSIANSFANNLQRVFQDWLNDDKNAVAARGMKADFASFADRLRRFESAQTGGNGAVARDLEQRFEKLTKPAVVASGGNETPKGPDRPVIPVNRNWWESASLPATLGIASGGQNLSFRLIRGPAGPVWICTTELSASAAEGAVSGILRRAEDLVPGRNRAVRRSWNKMVTDSNPIMPVDSGMIADVIAAFDKRSSSINPPPGGSVAFGLPTADEWKIAVLEQNGNQADDYPWGREWSHFYEPESGALAGAQTYDDLKAVDGDPNSNGRFHFLAGNAGDVVTSSPGSLSGLKIKGGSVFTTRDKSLFKASGGDVSLGRGSRDAGIRLVIRPRP